MEAALLRSCHSLPKVAHLLCTCVIQGALEELMSFIIIIILLYNTVYNEESTEM
jgi:hypothetical protein